MRKTIQSRYPVETSIGILLMIFSLSCFLAYLVFYPISYLVIFLLSVAVIIMTLVLWEEFLFPVRVKPEGGGVVFRNHRSKLKTQLLIYSFIPAIFVFIYFQVDVSLVRLIGWAAVCIIAPVAGKLISGLKNYNDFLKLTEEAIEYRNNEKTGVFKLNDVQQIVLLKDEDNVLHKIRLALSNGQNVIIDLDEMEIEVFYISIDQYITAHYANLVKG